jgi:branched-chain amino acid transport system ATP-binding protein
VTGPNAVEVTDAVVRFGGITALRQVSFDVPQGETFGVIGPNGAGKTALLNCMSGVYRLDEGSIRIAGRDIAHMRADRITKLGVARTFQSTEHFKQFTVLDYVLLGRLHHLPCSVLRTLVLWPLAQRTERRERNKALEVLERQGLFAYRDAELRDLPYGIQKRIDIARAVAAEPGIILMDEPTSGTLTNERAEISASIDAIAGSGLTTVLIDHDVDFVSRHCNRLLVLSYGAPLGIGSPEEMLKKPEVIEAFLGVATR